MQHLNSVVSISSKWMIRLCKDVDCSRNVRKITNPFKYDFKLLNFMCFIIIKQVQNVISK
jgi:hypothetical protein